MWEDQLIVGETIILDCTKWRGQAEPKQAHANSFHLSSNGRCHVTSCHKFPLPWLPSLHPKFSAVVDCNLEIEAGTHPFSLKLLLSVYFAIATDSETRQGPRRTDKI